MCGRTCGGNERPTGPNGSRIAANVQEFLTSYTNEIADSVVSCSDMNAWRSNRWTDMHLGSYVPFMSAEAVAGCPLASK
jgi:hypothetical protein